MWMWLSLCLSLSVVHVTSKGSKNHLKSWYCPSSSPTSDRKHWLWDTVSLSLFSLKEFQLQLSFFVTSEGDEWVRPSKVSDICHDNLCILVHISWALFNSVQQCMVVQAVLLRSQCLCNHANICQNQPSALFDGSWWSKTSLIWSWHSRHTIIMEKIPTSMQLHCRSYHGPKQKTINRNPSSIKFCWNFYPLLDKGHH